MKYVTNLKDAVSDRDSVVTLGKFDGLHRGHRGLFEKLKQFRAQQGLVTIAFTFDREIMFFKYGGKFLSILDKQERLEKFEEMDPDMLVECPFNNELRNMEAEDFVKNILVGQLRAKYIVIGKDFRFGHDRKGDYALLCALSKECGYEVQLTEEIYDGEERVSSSAIRGYLAVGNMEKANEMLGYDFSVEGEVIHGNELGRTIDMPTVNLMPAAGKLLPPFGVYASLVEMDGKIYMGVTNIGCKPTVGTYAVGAETHILHVSGDFYGKHIKVRMKSFLRPEQKFSSVEELKNQMHADSKKAEEILLPVMNE